MTTELLHDLLSDQASRAPDRLAVEDRAERATYAELDAASGHLAALLSVQGVGSGHRVGVLLEKSAAAVAAIFGVLKAGAAYVPLDSNAPGKRVAEMAEDGQLEGLITTRSGFEKLQPMLRPLPRCLVLLSADARLCSFSNAITVETHPPTASPAAPELRAGPGCHDAAYILYTSGSTGAPKGVVVTHFAAMSFVRWATAAFALRPADRLSSHAPFHFDLSVFDLFATVATGAAVVLVPPDVALFPRSLADWIAGSGISVWYSVPFALVQLVERAGLTGNPFPGLRLVLFAGEPFPPRQLGELMRLAPGARFFNLYGPTETNVCSSYQVAVPPAPDGPAIPIGRPCSHCTIRVIDEAGRIAAPGQIGELVVGGASLMQGYWRRAELTARSFVADPLNGAGGSPHYRTGDFGWLGEDGELRFLGRRDAQVKLRGHRVELGEIEAVLLRHPAILEVAVVAQPVEGFDARLIAFVVPKENCTLDHETLMLACRESLPVYMRPRELRFLRGLPRTTTGKLDRAALVQPRATRII